MAASTMYFLKNDLSVAQNLKVKYHVIDRDAFKMEQY